MGSEIDPGGSIVFLVKDEDGGVDLVGIGQSGVFPTVHGTMLLLVLVTLESLIQVVDILVARFVQFLGSCGGTVTGAAHQNDGSVFSETFLFQSGFDLGDELFIGMAGKFDHFTLFVLLELAVINIGQRNVLIDNGGITDEIELFRGPNVNEENLVSLFGLHVIGFLGGQVLALGVSFFLFVGASPAYSPLTKALISPKTINRDINFFVITTPF